MKFFLDWNPLPLLYIEPDEKLNDFVGCSAVINVIVPDNQIMQLSDPVRVRLGSHSDGGLRGDNEKAFIKTILQYKAKTTSFAL